ncbi:MAG: cyclase family protein [Thermodesulfobacteriota bacterium]
MKTIKGRIIDLSQEIYTGMPVYPGHAKTVIWEHMSHEESGRTIGTGFSYQTSGIMFCDHGPTHIDPVFHFSRDPKAESVDEIPLERCITSAVCLDVSDVPVQTQFGADKIKAELNRWQLDIRRGDTVLFYTGHFERFYGKPEYSTHQPGLTRDATEYIIDRGCINFGVDNTSPDMWLDKYYPCHRVCAERGVTHMENLCNLDKLVGKRFTFMALPLKIRRGTGSPLRPIAVLHEGEIPLWELHS